LDAEKLLDVLEGADVVAADPRDSKIVHLAKKNRHLNLENQKLKDKAAAGLAAAAKQAAEVRGGGNDLRLQFRNQMNCNR
jgi:regulator of replication initiation timing